MLDSWRCVLAEEVGEHDSEDAANLTGRHLPDGERRRRAGRDLDDVRAERPAIDSDDVRKLGERQPLPIRLRVRSDRPSGARDLDLDGPRVDRWAVGLPPLVEDREAPSCRTR